MHTIATATDTFRRAVPELAALTLAERRELHPREFEVHDRVRQARALVLVLLNDEDDDEGFRSAEAVHADALAGIASLLEAAHDALGLATSRAASLDMPESIEALTGQRVPDVLDGIPADFTDSALVRALAVVRLLGASESVTSADRRAALWTVSGLLDALVVVLERVRLFNESGA